MADHPSLLITILAFFLVLGPLVLVHELGHYLVGRWFGVKADAFSIGFGKELAGWTDKRGTRWKLSALPLGGYVQFAGDMNAASVPDTEAQDKLTPEERAQTFQVKPLYQRALIVLAGPLTNLIVAVAIFAAFNLIYGKPVLEAEVVGFAEKSDARAAGLRVGDRIVGIDGSKVESFSDIPEHVVYFPGRTISVAVERDGRTVDIPVKLSSQIVHDSFGNEARLADLGIDFAAPVVGGFSKDSPAQKAGLEEGDRIVAIDARPVASFTDVRRYVQASPGKTVSIRYRRDGREAAVRVTLGSALAGPQGKQEKVGLLGVRSGKVAAVGPVEAVTLAAGQSVAIMRSMVTGIVQIVTGERSVKELGGPIKIAKYSGEQFSLGWADYTWFVAMISINLAFINLLPIPALDGGHLAMYAAEAVRRKPLGARSQEWAFRTGMALVLALMLFVTVNDLITLPWFG